MSLRAAASGAPFFGLPLVPAGGGAHLESIPGHESWKCSQPQLEDEPSTEAAAAVF